MKYRERSQKSEQQGLRINTSVLTYNQRSRVPKGRLQNSGLTADKWPVPPGNPAASFRLKLRRP